MKHDVKIVYKKEKKLITLESYGNSAPLKREERERNRERRRVSKILTPNYYSNKNAN
jgi:hypothetical protein